MENGLKIGFEELREIQYRILCDFDDYCRENGLRYFLYAGTLLGAVRHGGFIPWDDDIDVIMPRCDYENYLHLSETEGKKVKPYYENYAVDLKENCISPFVKLVDERTDGREGFIEEKYHNGVWIDIFPLDGFPEEEAERARFIAGMQKRIKMISLSSRPLVFSPNPLRMAKRLAIFFLFRWRNTRKIAKTLQTLAKQYPYEGSSFIGVSLFGGGKNNVTARAGFEAATLLPFRERQFPAPESYQKYLSELFGEDYMTPPPPEKRISRHEYTAWWKTARPAAFAAFAGTDEKSEKEDT